MREVFLEENKSKYSINDEANLSLDITESAKELPFSEVKDVLSLYELYNSERDNCGKYRMIFTINSFCSNVLFNMKSEVVKNEGSTSCERLFDTSNHDKTGAISQNNLSLKQAIRDTEYSYEGDENGRGFTYHCGLDIFNNHTLRTDEYVHVNTFNTFDTTLNKDKNIWRYFIDPDSNNYNLWDTKTDLEEDTFNTIRDYRRTNLGDSLRSPNFATTSDTSDRITEHIYEYATLKSMQTAISDNLEEKDGWYGFTNPSTARIEITNESNDVEELLNRTINSEDACSFINMYPGKEDYSFVPRYNPYLRRLEKNWDYCITYPYENDYDKFNEINANSANSIQVIDINVTNKYEETGTERNANDIVCFTTKIRHNLKTGDSFILTYKNGDVYNQKETPITVVGVGDSKGHDSEHKFRFSAEPVLNYIKNGKLLNNFVYIQKRENGATMQYYFRKFKKLQNFKSDLDTFYDSSVDINNISGFTTVFSNEINNMAFGQTIYGDKTAQLVFTDDINIDRIVDNNGNPVSELYLTFIKRNKGHEAWYGSTAETIDCSEIEYSHCFGKVTSGIEMADDFDGSDYNIHKMHNHDLSGIDVPEGQTDQTEKYISMVPIGAVLEDDIKIESGDTFYGDIVEYNSVTAVETTIEKVYHRFNTAQRELNSSAYYNIYDDELVKDDFDFNGTTTKEIDFCVTEQLANMVSGDSTSLFTIAGNVEREGYYYQPHYRIAVRELGEAQTCSAIFINNDIEICTTAEINELKSKYDWLNHDLTEGGMALIKITSPKDYDFQTGDYFNVVNILLPRETYAAKVINISGLTLTLETSTATTKAITAAGTTHSKKYKLYKSKNGYHDGIKFAMSSNPKFVYREIVPPSEINHDSELYDLPFANGAFYIEQKINFYLKRQDPFGKYGLSKEADDEAEKGNPMKEYLYIPGTEYTVEADEIVIDGFGGTCNV